MLSVVNAMTKNLRVARVVGKVKVPRKYDLRTVPICRRRRSVMVHWTTEPKGFAVLVPSDPMTIMEASEWRMLCTEHAIFEVETRHYLWPESEVMRITRAI